MRSENKHRSGWSGWLGGVGATSVLLSGAAIRPAEAVPLAPVPQAAAVDRDPASANKPEDPAVIAAREEVAALVNVITSVRDKKGKAATEKEITQHIHDLGSRSYRVREAASRELLEIGSIARDALFKAVKDDDLERVFRARRILGTLAHRASQQRLAVEKLGELGSENHKYHYNRERSPVENAIPVLRSILEGTGNSELSSEDKTALKLSIVHAMGGMGADVDGVLSSLLDVAKNDKDMSLRAAAIGELGGFGAQSSDMVPDLVSMLKDDHAVLHMPLVKALGNIKSNAEVSVPALRTFFKGADADMKLAVIASLEKIGAKGSGVIDGLLDALQEKTLPIVRKNAADVLAKFGEDAKKAVPVLIASYHDENNEVRTSIIKALGYIGADAEKVVPVLVEALTDKDAPVRSKAAYGLGRFRGKARVATDALLVAVKDSDTSVRQESISALGNIRPDNKKVIDVLIDALDDKNDTIRWVAASSLGQFGEKAEAAIPVLMNMMNKDEGNHIRNTAINALGQIASDAKQVLPAFRAVLRDKNRDEYEKGVVAQVLSQFGKDAAPAVPELFDILNDPNIDTEYMDPFLGALASIGPKTKGVVTGLGDMLTNPNIENYAKEQITYTLDGFGKDAADAVPQLTAALSDPNQSYAQYAFIGTLANIGPDVDGVTSAMGMVMGDPLQETYIRKYAIEKLGDMGAKAKGTVSGLLAALKDQDSSIRSEAISSLRKIGPAAKEALPALKVIMDDKAPGNNWSERDRKKAEEAIQAIKQAPAPKMDPGKGQSRAEQMRNEDVPLYQREHLRHQERVARTRTMPLTRS